VIGRAAASLFMLAVVPGGADHSSTAGPVADRLRRDLVVANRLLTTARASPPTPYQHSAPTNPNRYLRARRDAARPCGPRLHQEFDLIPSGDRRGRAMFSLASSRANHRRCRTSTS